MILRRRLWTLSTLYLILLSMAFWLGGRQLGWDPRASAVGLALIYLSCGGLLALAELCFIRPLRRRLIKLDDLIRTLDPSPPPPRIRGADEIELIRLDLRRLFQRLDQARGDMSVRRIRAEVDSRTDPLTRLHNQRSFAGFLAEEWERARRARTSLSLLIIDVDRFKSFNDELGHLVGNQVLERIAAVLKHCARETDLAFRYAGDEFAILLPRAGIEQALAVAEKIRAKVGSQRMEALGQRQMTVSTGAAEIAPEMQSPDDLVQAADRALYFAKEAGRNVVAYADRRAGLRLYKPGEV
ncbi:MAG: GGDEF domain-containing protein [Patescibacteria group bacterium]